MTDPVFLAPPEALRSLAPGATLEVSGEEAHHALRVRRVRVGEPIQVVDGEGRRVHGTVAHVLGRDSLRVEVATIEDEPEPSPRIVVVQALAKADRGERAVEVMTEVGVDVIVPWSAQRSIAEWSTERADRGRQRWRATAVQAAKQSRRARIPQLADLVDLDGACAWVRGADRAFLLDAHGGPSDDLGATGDQGSVVLVVGPEGGLEEHERAALQAAGAVCVSLGPTILRTSTAGVVGAALVLAATRWRDRVPDGQDRADSPGRVDAVTGFPT